MVEELGEQRLVPCVPCADGEASSTSGATEHEDLELKNVLEATFGPGALASLSELNLDDPSCAAMAADPEFEAISRQWNASQPSGPTPEPAQKAHHKDTTVTENRDCLSNLNKPGGATATDSTLLMFELDAVEFGIPIANVVEIRQLPDVTSVARGPTWFLGLANLRGNVIPVLSLRLVLRLSPGDSLQTGHMIVVRAVNAPNPTGVIVDRVSGLDNTIDLTKTDNGEEGVVSGWIERDGHRVAVLDVDKLLSADAVHSESV